jgi:hypothetical protein
MALTQMRLLSNLRLTRIIGTLAAELEIKRPLVYLARCPLVNAFDDELVGRFTGKIIAADIVTDDQKALVNESMTLELVTHAVPNIKIGQRLNQKLLNRLKKLEQNSYATEGGENALKDWDMAVAENLLLAVRQRLNAMACAMMIDSFSYNRFGVQISGATWGMPAGLKITIGTAWGTNPTTATPLNDIWSADQYARLNYGIEYDTITMGTQDFRDMVATTEFANKAAIPLSAHFLTTPAALPTKNDPAMQKIAADIMGKKLILDDAKINERANDGTITTTKVLPLHAVLLSRSEDENNGQSYDIANGVVTESIVSDLAYGGDFGLGGEQYGPVGYYTPAAYDNNPPGVVAWGVARAFPRKHVPETTAVLTVG